MTLRRRADLSDVAVLERPAESRRRADRARRVPERPREPAPLRERERDQEPPTQPPRTRFDVGSVATSAPADGQATTAPELPPAPEPGISAEQVAAQQEQVAAAQATLDGAADTPALMAALAEAPPTVKAQVAGELGSRADRTLAQETGAIQQATPEVGGEMAGNQPAAAGKVTAPSQEVTLEATPPPEPAAEAVVGVPVATPSDYQANAGVSGQLARTFRAEEGARGVERALDSVQTTDPGIVTSPGSAPPIPQQGESDPQRMENQVAAGRSQAQGTLSDQQQQVRALPGADRVQLAGVQERESVGELAAPSAEQATAPEEAQQFLAMNNPPELQAAFNEVAGPQMQQSMAEARGQMDQAAQERDAAHQQEVETAQRESAAAQQQAEGEQRSAVAESRRTIETQRQATLDQQQAAVEDVERQADERSGTDRQAASEQVRSDQQQLDERYRQAERDAEGEVQRGERDAEAERRRAEREARDQSWWEAALDFITDLFDALVGLINRIFDAVRAAVNAILNAVRDFALALIERVATFLKGLINAFGQFLKGLVQGLLGDIFPGLARALTAAIDGAVALANRAIDAAANALRAAVNRIVEALRAGINALINAYQAAVNAALALARAALSGDWGAFLIQLIEAGCRVAGIDPARIFAFIGRATETIRLIVDNPGGFLSNLLGALAGGIRRFAGNFLTHLQAGIIGWLTGALGGAGITLPERFDLMGVVSLVAQVLGLTWQNLRQRIVRLIGERGVQLLEFVAGYVQTLITGGWNGLWQRIQSDLGTLRDMVLDQIRSFLVERVVMAAVTRLATMFNPVGALVNLLIAAYQFYTFLRDQLQRIAQVVSTVVEAIGNIARGVLGPAQERVESVLASLLPLAIDLLARLLGLGNVGERVRAILTRVQETIWRAIDRLIERVVGLFRGGGQGTQPRSEQPPTPAAAGNQAIGERVPIPAEGSHTLYIVREQRNAVVVAASTPMSVTDRLAQWRQAVANRRQGDLYPPPASRATPLLDRAEQQLQTLDSSADSRVTEMIAREQAAAATPAATPAARTQALVREEQALAQTLARLFEMFGERTPGSGLGVTFQGNIAMAHRLLQRGLGMAIEALQQSSPPALTTWDQVREALRTRSLAGVGQQFQQLFQSPFNQNAGVSFDPFTTHVHNDLLINPLQQAISDAKAGRRRDPDLAQSEVNVATWLPSQKDLMNRGSSGFARSAAALRTLMFEDRAESRVAAILLEELIGRAKNAESSPFHLALDSDRVVAMVEAERARLVGSANPNWVAVFAAAGRRIEVRVAAGRYRVGQGLTLADVLGNSGVQAATTTLTSAFVRAINASGPLMRIFSPTPAEIAALASWAAGRIVRNVQTQPLYFVRPTDIPRNVPQNVRYVKVNPTIPEGRSVAQSLYRAIGGAAADNLDLSETEIHHFLPLYAGGGNEELNLAVVFGGASDRSSPHGALHDFMDTQVDLTRFLVDPAATGQVTLSASSLERFYGGRPEDLHVLIGILLVSGAVEWRDTGVPLVVRP